MNKVASQSKNMGREGRLILWLSAVLVVQLVVAALLRYSQTSYQPVEASAPILTIDFGKVTKIVVSQSQPFTGGSPTKAVIQQQPTGWILPDHFKFPASESTRKKLFDSLKESQKGYPVATTAGAADRFKVAPNNFMRSIALWNDQNALATLYLGDSASPHATYARLDGSDDIFVVDLPIMEVNSDPNLWIDKNFAQLKIGDIAAIEMNHFNWQRQTASGLSLSTTRLALSMSQLHCLSLID